ncbi:transmembrane and coiled-coil domains protein 1-like [Pempheris klunzingeri]|uniref:transmembrane and coiled-coil domains protein 1-like n=1 Tax=Pempheris klunzingeri TaxID=3127111 RepID=UPI0039818B79
MKADTIAALKDLDETQGDEGVGPGGTRTLRTGQLCGSNDDCTSSAALGPGGSPSPMDNTPDHDQASSFDATFHEIQELRENQRRLEECFENLKACHKQEYTVIMEALQEEQYRCERLEEQLSDMTELHQNEIFNLSQELASMEEITYQPYEKAMDVHEALEACQKRLFKMEQQQVVQLEGLENTTARTLLGKLINVLLVVMAVILVFVSTGASCLISLMKTCSCMFFTLLFLLLISLLWRHWDAILEYQHYFFCSQHPEKGGHQ